MPKSTANDVIKRYKQTLTIDKAALTNWKQVTSKWELKSKVIRSLRNNPGLSDQDRATKFNSTRGIIERIRVRTGYKSYRAIKYPNRSDKQSLVVKKRTRLLYDTTLTKVQGYILIDEKTYVELDVTMDKFDKKVQIW